VLRAFDGANRQRYVLVRSASSRVKRQAGDQGKRAAFEPMPLDQDRVSPQASVGPRVVIAPAIGLSRRWLDENPTAAKAQRKAAVLLHVINSIAAAFNDEKRYVVLYLNTEQPELHNDTPADLLKKGKLESLASYIDEVVAMRPD